MTIHPKRTWTRWAARAAVPVISLTTAAAVGMGVDSAVAQPSGQRGAMPAAVTVHIARVQTNLARAIARVEAHRPGLAVRSLRVVRREVVLANTAAGAQIGRPPIDPESDDAPGPPSVLAVLRLDHKVSSTVVDLLDGRKSTTLVQTQRQVLYAAQVRRDTLLDAVIALPAEGDGADYADGMADTLGSYTGEVAQLTNALQTYELTASARTGLTNSLARVSATKAKVDQAFGGGERGAPK